MLRIYWPQPGAVYGHPEVWSSLIYGGLYGLTVYGVFDFTNMAIFDNYELPVAVLDTVWGGFICALVTYLSFQIKEKFL